MKLTKEYWDTCYINKDTRWDLGEISRPIKEYVDQLEDRDISILIPGGGNSHEAEYIFNIGFKNTHVVDISPLAVSNFIKRVPSYPKQQIINHDFFEFEGSYDLIIEQTFFCAIDRDLRPAYAKQMASLLQAGGKLVGLLFNAPLYEDHPPYGGCPEEYQKYFEPYFIIEIMDACHNSIEPRAGREVWVKMTKK